MVDPGADTRRLEWLEADGLGGFASGTVSGARTRRYQGLLLVARRPPIDRVMLVNGFDAWLETDGGSFPLSTQFYTPGVAVPEGERHFASFTREPWPTWRFACGDGIRLTQEIFVPRGLPVACLSLHVEGRREGRMELNVRPFLSGRDFHSLQRENAGFHMEPDVEGETVQLHPYVGIPGIAILSTGSFAADPVWYLNFLYEEERDRGLDCVEDLASPGIWSFDLAAGPAELLFTTPEGRASLPSGTTREVMHGLKEAERRRRAAFPSPLHRSADAYFVARGTGESLIAGYPWFSDWGRDTFIALRGLCLAAGRLEAARAILLEWAQAVSGGMLPNRFPDAGEEPEYNSVDAALWYVVAAGEFIQAWAVAGRALAEEERNTLFQAVAAILEGYAAGTRFGIRLDADGLLTAGEPGLQLTWMDARVGDWVVTPRTGKPVEIQALWLNALRVGCDLLIPQLGHSPEHAELRDRWREWYGRGYQSFLGRFWCEADGYLYDVVDCNHHDGTFDPTFRPNQIFAVGGLPIRLVEGDRARRVIEQVEARLWTPLGLRTLSPGEMEYRGIYTGNVSERDTAYHQGTAWAWLLGAFVDAWVRVWGGTSEARREARRRFLDPLIQHLEEAGLGHVSEIADGDPPHRPRGCPFQAWSLGEMIRIDAMLREDPSGTEIQRTEDPS